MKNKSLYLIIDKKTQYIIGAYPTSNETEFELVYLIGSYQYNKKDLSVRIMNDVADDTYHRLIHQYKRKINVWN